MFTVAGENSDKSSEAAAAFIHMCALSQATFLYYLHVYQLVQSFCHLLSLDMFVFNGVEANSSELRWRK